MKAQFIQKTLKTLVNPKFLKKALVDTVLPNIAFAALMVVGSAFSSRNDYDEYTVPTENYFDPETLSDGGEDIIDDDTSTDSIDDEA